MMIKMTTWIKSRTNKSCRIPKMPRMKVMVMVKMYCMRNDRTKNRRKR